MPANRVTPLIIFHFVADSSCFSAKKGTLSLDLCFSSCPFHQRSYRPRKSDVPASKANRKLTLWDEREGEMYKKKNNLIKKQLSLLVTMTDGGGS